MRVALQRIFITLCACAAVAVADIEVQQVVPKHDPAAMPALLSADWKQPSLGTAKPVWEHVDGDRGYTAWAAASPEGLLFRFRATDSDHSRSFRERNLWRGDCVFLMLDARGDSDDGVLTDDMGADDALFIFGLGADGPDAGFVQTGNPALTRDDALAMIRSITRDDSAGITEYLIGVPWDKVAGGLLQASSVGLAITVKDSGEAEDEDIDWGNARRWRKDPRRYHRFALPAPSQDGVSVAALRHTLVGKPDTARFALAARLARLSTATVAIGERTRTIELRAGDVPRRWCISIPDTHIGPDASAVSITVKQKRRIMTTQQFDIVSPEVLRDTLQRRISTLLAGTDENLLVTHLNATLAVVNQAYANLDFPVMEEPGRGLNRREQFVETVSYLLQRLPEERIELTPYTTACIPLVRAFVSSRDYSLQFYGLQLPYGWQPGTQYPLFVYLHGMGPGHPLQGLQLCFDNRHQDTIFRDSCIDSSAVPAGHRGFVVSPWGRGNNSYRGFAESDVLEIVEHVRNDFEIERDRMYLTGFSMGCDGSLNIATRRPDLWQAVNLAAGFHRVDEWLDSPLLDNLAGIPLKLWVGDMDTHMYEGMKRFIPVAARKKFVFESEVVADIPHTYPYDEYMDNCAWLLEHPPRARDSFSYVTDDRQYRGVRGITMNVPAGIAAPAYPRFSCSIEGNTVTIESENTTGLAVELGDSGLGMSGEVTLVWNGKQAYRGEPKTVEVGEAPRRR